MHALDFPAKRFDLVLLLHALTYSRRNVYTDNFFSMLNTASMAGFAFMRNGLPFAMTNRAGSGCPHLPDKSIGDAMNLAAAFAIGALVH
jgi:hypothetical protein